MLPHLVRQRDGTTILVEDRRHRAIASPVTQAALERTLGPARDVADANVHATNSEQARDVRLVSPSDMSALVSQAPPGASIAVTRPADIDCSDLDPALRPLTIDPPRHGGGDPERGDGALDRLARSRAQGVTHLLVPATHDPWLLRHAQLADHLARRATIVACNAAGTLWALAPPRPRGGSKVFVIGLPKTGTTSLHRSFDLLGLRSFHWGGRRAYQAVLQSLRDGERLLEGLGERHDAYSDIETLSVRFDLADLQYPGSRFVFTVRDVDDWIASRRRHVERNERGRLDGTYSGRNLGIDEDAWRANWFAHCDRVTAWFRGRDDLLTLDICAGEGWERLAPFLDRPTPDAQFPRENVDGEVSSRFAWRRRRR
ncbi:MAG: sulfotransferase [Acidimicrobiia bacterium]